MVRNQQIHLDANPAAACIRRDRPSNPESSARSEGTDRRILSLQPSRRAFHASCRLRRQWGMPPFPLPLPGDREKALPDLLYEIEMFHRLVSSRPADADRVRERHWMEGVLLHARNLIEFFADRRQETKLDTMHASDFWFDEKPALPENLKHIIHRALAHPSYSRAKWRETRGDSYGLISWDGVWEFADFGSLWETAIAFVAHVANEPRLSMSLEERERWRQYDVILKRSREQERLDVIGTTTSLGGPPRATIKAL